MAHGTPETTDGIAPYYTHIRHGRAPGEGLLQALKDRYQAIGGLSPLGRITRLQVQALASCLNADEGACLNVDGSTSGNADGIGAPGGGSTSQSFRVFLGYKHVAPYIEDAVAQMHEQGITRAVGLVLAPHYSRASVQQYHDRAQQAAQALGGPVLHPVRHWYAQPQFIAYWARQLRMTLGSVPMAQRDRTAVIFSAHSLPEQALGEGDPYRQQVFESARLIAWAAGLPRHHVGWQSAGRTQDTWIGPDIRALTQALWRTGSRTFVYCPVGFVADHLEVLYDNDIECRADVEALGGRYLRVAMPNDDPSFIDGLCAVVQRTLAAVPFSASLTTAASAALSPSQVFLGGGRSIA